MITPTFYVWKFKGVQFIAVERGADVHVVDDQGHNYGTWHTAKRFRKEQKKGEPIAAPLESPQAFLAVRLR